MVRSKGISELDGTNERQTADRQRLIIIMLVAVFSTCATVFHFYNSVLYFNDCSGSSSGNDNLCWSSQALLSQPSSSVSQYSTEVDDLYGFLPTGWSVCDQAYHQYTSAAQDSGCNQQTMQTAASQSPGCSWVLTLYPVNAAEPDSMTDVKTLQTDELVAECCLIDYSTVENGPVNQTNNCAIFPASSSAFQRAYMTDPQVVSTASALTMAQFAYIILREALLSAFLVILLPCTSCCARCNIVKWAHSPKGAKYLLNSSVIWLLLPFKTTRKLLVAADREENHWYFVLQVLVLDLPTMILPFYIFMFNGVAGTNYEALISFFGALGMIIVTLCRALYLYVGSKLMVSYARQHDTKHHYNTQDETHVRSLATEVELIVG